MQRLRFRRRPHADNTTVGRVGLATRQLERDEPIDEGRDRGRADREALPDRPAWQPPA